MQNKERINKKIRGGIIILSVISALSITAAAAVMVGSYQTDKKGTSVTIPAAILAQNENRNEEQASAETDDKAVDSSFIDLRANKSKAEDDTAVVISLYDGQPQDNQLFNAENMFPGDAEVNRYCVRVSYNDAIKVRFHADIKPGYEKLAEVLKCRVTLLKEGGNTVLYDGLMKSMPESIDQSLSTETGTTSDLYYEITVYLETSVGNEYQDKELTADFRWWVEETGNLDPAPPTGDNSKVALFAALAVCSLIALALLLFIKRRNKEDK